MAMTANDHSWLIVDVGRKEARSDDRPFLADHRYRSVGILLTLDLGPVDVVDMPENGFGIRVRGFRLGFVAAGRKCHETFHRLFA